MVRSNDDLIDVSKDIAENALRGRGKSDTDADSQHRIRTYGGRSFGKVRGRGRIGKTHPPCTGYIPDLIFITILIILTGYIHLDTYDMPALDERAESAVDSYYRGMITSQLSVNSGMTSGQKVIEAQSRYEDIIDSEEADALRKATAEQFKSSYRDPDGENYLYGADSYYYYRQVLHEIDDGVEPEQNLPRLYASVHRIISPFFGTSVKQSITYMPLMFSILSIVLIYLIGRHLRDAKAGFIAGLFLTLTSSFLLNTRIGFIDTNSLNIFFSLLTVFLFLKTNTLDIRGTIAGILMLIATVAFAAFWKGFYYIPLLIILTIGVLAGLYYMTAILKMRAVRYIPVLVMLIMAIMTALIAFFQSRSFDTLMKRLTFSTGFYPSGLLTVAELQGYTFGQVIGAAGGLVILSVVAASLLYHLYGIASSMFSENAGDLKGFYQEYADRVFIILYMLALFLVPFMAKRFTVYMLIPYSIFLGLGVSIIVERFLGIAKMGSLSNILKHSIEYSILAIISLFIFILLSPGLASAQKTIPHMNDAIYDTAIAIRDNSTEDAVINMWWDYGYLYNAIADREVSFDGGSFESSRLHWISLALLTGDENLSYGILRMLGCEEERSVFNIVNYTQEESGSIDIIHEIVVLDKDAAGEYLDSLGISRKLLDLTHCDAPESFVVVGNELERKLSILNYYGNFDFRRNSDKNLISSMKKEEAIQYLGQKYQIDRGMASEYYLSLVNFDPEKISSTTLKSDNIACSENEYDFICQDGFVIERVTMDAYKGDARPHSLLYYDAMSSTLSERVYEDKGFDYTIVMINSDKDYMFLVNPEFRNSMLINFLYFDGAGLEHFEKFTEYTNPQKVVSYRIID